MTEICHIIKNGNINTMLQPIHQVEDSSVIGFEVLSRGPEGRYYSPNNLFSAASKERRLVEMEMVCFKQALKHSVGNSQLFLNFSSNTIIQCQQEIANSLWRLNRPVIELSEVGTRSHKHNRLIKVLENLRHQGVQIALDDVGGGTKDFSHICEVPFDYLKIDRSLVRGITRYKNGSAVHYKEFLLFITGLAKQLNAQVIAEGVETEMQLAGIRRVGINIVQGFYFSRPTPVKELCVKHDKGKPAYRNVGGK